MCDLHVPQGSAGSPTRQEPMLAGRGPATTVLIWLIELYRRQDAILTRDQRSLLGKLGQELSDVDLNRSVVFDRGFVAELKLDASLFLKSAEAIAALKPLPAVTVWDGGRYLERLLEDQKCAAGRPCRYGSAEFAVHHHDLRR